MILLLDLFLQSLALLLLTLELLVDLRGLGTPLCRWIERSHFLVFAVNFTLFAIAHVIILIVNIVLLTVYFIVA